MRRLYRTRFYPPQADQIRGGEVQLRNAFEPVGSPRLGRLPFGYRSEKGSVIASNHWAAARWLVLQLLGNELNCARTISELPADFPWKPTSRGLMLWVQNPILRGGIGRRPRRGTQSYAWVDWGMAPALLWPDEWDGVLRLLSQRNKRGRHPGGAAGLPHLLSGLIRCEGCGKRLRWHTPQRRQPDSLPTARYACTQKGCKFSGRGIREDLVRAAIIKKLHARARPRMAELARQGGWITGGWAKAIEHPKLLKMRALRDQLRAVREQGIPKLGPAICWLTDQMLPLQAWGGDEMWLDQIYGSLLRDSGTLEKASDDLLRPVFLHFVIEVVYQGSPEAFIIRLR